MSDEEKIKQQLEEKFSFLNGIIAIKRKGRIFADVPLDKFEQVFDYVVIQLQFDAISTITGMDEGDSFLVIYHLHRKGSIILNLKVKVSKENPTIKSVTSVFPSAEMYERELMDLLGMKVDGLPEGRRYPLPDDWPKDEHPLLKDWKKDNLGQEMKNE